MTHRDTPAAFDSLPGGDASSKPPLRAWWPQGRKEPARKTYAEEMQHVIDPPDGWPSFFSPAPGGQASQEAPAGAGGFFREKLPRDAAGLERLSMIQPDHPTGEGKQELKLGTP